MTEESKTEEVEWSQKRRGGDLKPNPELWAALNNGEGLNEILTNFYAIVFKDEKLGHFFSDVTVQWAIGKQFSYLKEIITGEKVYFGDRPRNAHHHMVISDALFDYRERLIEKCMRDWGLADEHVKSWLTIHEVFRKHIVKDKAIPKKVRGVSLPLEGYEWMDLAAGCLCDGCQSEADVGSHVAYHVRTGKLYCQGCAPAEALEQREETVPQTT